jgi:tryptophan 2,3-dioxygenase
MTHRALQAALLISLYRDEPMFQLPYRVLTALSTMDEMISSWRYRHMAMAQRMIGSKIGTGGSSGYRPPGPPACLCVCCLRVRLCRFGYLRSTVGERYRVFSDITNLSTYLVARSQLPVLPDALREQLRFRWTPEDASAAAAPAAQSDK